MRKLVFLCLAMMVLSAWVLRSAKGVQAGGGTSGRMTQRTTSPSELGPGRKGQPASPQDEAVVRRVFDDLFNGGRYELTGTIYTQDCSVHFGGKTSRLEDSVTEGKGWREAAPDVHMTIGTMSTRGDKVLVSWTAMGTNTGQGNGLRPSGKHFVIHGRSQFRVVNGKIAEVWNHWNRDSLYRQLGVNPRLGRLYDEIQELWSSFNGLANARPLSASLQ
jgi:predicted ester cyclase